MIVAGAGLAGLVAAVRARELGASPRLLEKGSRAGGSMLLSSGVIWRHRRFEDFRRECPGGDESLQRLVWERLDESLAWLRELGAPVVWEETGNPLTTGLRFEPRGLTLALLGAAGGAELNVDGCQVAEPGEPLILATGGFAASPELIAEHIRPAAALRLRANPWSAGDGLRLGVNRGAATSAGLDEFYGRAMPNGTWGEAEFVSASALFGRFARIFDADGVEFMTADEVWWSEANLAQAIAHRPGARAFLVLDEAGLAGRVRERTVAELVAAMPVVSRHDPRELPFAPPAGAVVAVEVVAAITHTVGGLRIDAHARVLDDVGEAIPGLFAAGVDAGGIATGGYASGLAQALVLGRVAAESACATA